VPADDLPGPGCSANELLDSLGQPGGVRAFLVMGSSVAVSAPNALHIECRLKELDFLLVADYFLSETAMLADVVLPGAQWAEEEGTMTKQEWRVIRRRRVAAPPAVVRTDLDVLIDLATRLGMGHRFDFDGPRADFDELHRASAGVRPITLASPTRGLTPPTACSGRIPDGGRTAWCSANRASLPP
jgi:assimilatory nitrate reductase catalytic subunit